MAGVKRKKKSVRKKRIDVRAIDARQLNVPYHAGVVLTGRGSGGGLRKKRGGRRAFTGAPPVAVRTGLPGAGNPYTSLTQLQQQQEVAQQLALSNQQTQQAVAQTKLDLALRKQMQSEESQRAKLEFEREKFLARERREDLKREDRERREREQAEIEATRPRPMEGTKDELLGPNRFQRPLSPEPVVVPAPAPELTMEEMLNERNGVGIKRPASESSLLERPSKFFAPSSAGDLVEGRKRRRGQAFGTSKRVRIR